MAERLHFHFEACRILTPQPGIETVSTAGRGGVLTTGKCESVIHSDVSDSLE